MSYSKLPPFKMDTSHACARELKPGVAHEGHTLLDHLDYDAAAAAEAEAALDALKKVDDWRTENAAEGTRQHAAVEASMSAAPPPSLHVPAGTMEGIKFRCARRLTADVPGWDAPDSVKILLFEGKDKWAVWAVHNLYRCAVDWMNGDLLYALRGYAQAREYQGRNGGWLPAGVSDDLHSMRTAIESLVSNRGGR